MEVKKYSLFKTVFGMMINPAGTLKGALQSTKWYFSLVISALAFALFFMQTGLDLFKTGQKPMGYVILTALVGGGYGLIVIPILGCLIWLILKIGKSSETLTTTISAFCLSYSGALIYGIVGLIFSLVLGWKTAIAFGVTGVLWAVGPMIVSIRQLTGGKNVLSIPIATIVSGLILLSWAFLGESLGGHMERVNEIKKGWPMKRLVYRLCFTTFGVCAFYNPLARWNPYYIAFGAVFGLLFGFVFKLFLKVFLNTFNRGLKKEMGKVPVKYAVDTGMLFLLPFAVMLILATYVLHWSQTMGFITTGIMAVGTASAIEMGRIKGQTQLRNTIATTVVCFLFSAVWTLSMGFLTVIPAYIEGGIQLIKSLLT